MKNTELSKSGNQEKGKKGKPIITMTIIKEDTGYSAFAEIGKNSIFTDGETFDELKDNIIEAVNLTFEASGFSYTADEILLSLDKSEYNSLKETSHLMQSEAKRTGKSF